MLRALLPAALLLTVAAGPVAPPMALVEIESGRTEAGRPWFTIEMGRPYPPAGLYSWYLGVAIATDQGQVQYVVQEHEGRRDARLTGASGRVVVQARPDGRVLIVLPVRAQARDPFVVLSGQRVVPEDRATRWARGTRAHPLRLGSRVGDPLEGFGSPPASPDATAQPRPSPGPESQPRRGGGPVEPGTVLLGVLLGLAALSIFRRRHPGARAVVAGVLGLGAAVGAGVGAFTIGAQPGAAVGLVAGMVLMGFGPSRRATA